MTARKPCPQCAFLQAQNDRLLGVIEGLTAKASRPAQSPAVKPPPPDAEIQAMRAIEAEVLQQEAKVLATTAGIPESQALAEVQRLRGIALSTRVDPTAH